MQFPYGMTADPRGLRWTQFGRNWSHLVQTAVLVAPIIASSGTANPFPVGEGVAAELQLPFAFVMRCLEKLDFKSRASPSPRYIQHISRTLTSWNKFMSTS